MQWYYADAQQVQQGPMSASDLLAAFKAGKFKAESMVWRDGLPDWRPFSQFATEFGMDHEDLYPSNEMNLMQISAPLPKQDYSNPYAAPNAAIRSDSYESMDGHEIVYAGFWKRFAALMLDSMIVGIGASIIAVPIGAIIGFSAGSMAQNGGEPSGAMLGVMMLFYLLLFAGIILYEAYFHSSASGATLGKQLIGIKVVDINGDRISFMRSLGRYFAKIISGIPMYIGYIMAGFTEKKQGLHDIICSTIVVDKHAFTSSPQLQNRELGGCATAVIAVGVLGILGYFGLIFFAVVGGLAGQ